MKTFKRRVVNSYYAILYQFCCVPILTIISFLIYSHFIIGNNLGGSLVGYLVIALLVAANLALIYGISLIYIKKIKLPLLYHIIVGAFTMVLLLWLNVYYGTVESITCADYNAVECIDSIVNGRSAILSLIACAAYYLLYIFIYKIVEKSVKKEAIA